jgi:hypothetical protein
MAEEDSQSAWYWSGTPSMSSASKETDHTIYGTYDGKSPMGTVNMARDAAIVRAWSVVDTESDWYKFFPA